MVVLERYLKLLQDEYKDQQRRYNMDAIIAKCVGVALA